MPPSPKHRLFEARTLAFFAFFFLVITAFWSMKPLRTSGVIKAVGMEWYPLVKTLLVVVMPPVVMIFSWLAGRWSRHRLAVFFLTLFLAMALGFYALFQWHPATWTKVAFFYFVDAYVTVMTALFWMYLNDVFHHDEARRLYPAIGAGGVLGGILGSSVSGFLSEQLGNSIILVAGLFLVPLYGVLNALETHASNRPAVPGDAEHHKRGLRAALEGFVLASRSAYLFALVLMVGLYEIASTVVDYLFNEAASAAFPQRDAMGAFLGQVSFYAGWAGLAVQVILLPLLLRRRRGLQACLLALPLLMLGGAVGFALVPGLVMATLALGGEGAFSYSMNQTTKEVMYTPLTPNEKYRAKAVIDMFVMRGAKTCGGLLLLFYGLWLAPRGVSGRLLMAVNAGIILVWLAAAWYVGRRFLEKTSASA